MCNRNSPMTDMYSSVGVEEHYHTCACTAHNYCLLKCSLKYWMVHVCVGDVDK